MTENIAFIRAGSLAWLNAYIEEPMCRGNRVYDLISVSVIAHVGFNEQSDAEYSYLLTYRYSGGR